MRGDGSNKLAKQIEYTATDNVATALGNLGRTEDVKFSPDNRRLVIVGYTRNRILVIDLEVASSANGKTMALTDCVEVESAAFDEPHGVCFLNDETVIVANRHALAPVVKLPSRGTEGGVVPASILGTIAGGALAPLKSPGSVSAIPLGGDRYEVFFCNNYVHYVTRHVLDMGRGARVRRNRLLLRRGLQIPDGVAVGRSRRWIAISNHNTHSVFVYANTLLLNRYSRPSATLNQVTYPHGVCFARDDRFVVVADAGAPFVHVYAGQDSGWRGPHDPVASFRVMDEPTFLRGRYNPQEGGPKGIDIDRDGQLLAVTCEHQVLAFFDLATMLDPLQGRSTAVAA